MFELCSTIEATDQSKLFRFAEFEIGVKIADSRPRLQGKFDAWQKSVTEPQPAPVFTDSYSYALVLEDEKGEGTVLALLSSVNLSLQV